MFDDSTGLILDGGKATRFGGQHKAFLEVDGRSIAARTRELFGQMFPSVLVATAHPEPWQALDVSFVQDPIRDAGPLAGIAAGLSAANTPLLFVVAGDMPELSRSEIEELLKRARQRPGHAVVPRMAGHAEPLHAVYPTARAKDCHRDLLAGKRRVTDFLATLPVTWVDADERPALSRSLRNVNSPSDLDAATP